MSFITFAEQCKQQLRPALFRIRCFSLLIIGFLVLSLFALPVFAASGTAGKLVVLQPDKNELRNPAFGKGYQSLLTSLKQVDKSFSTISSEKSSRIRGTRLIIPVSDATGKSFFARLDKGMLPESTYLILVPMLNTENQDFSAFLTRYGFTVKGGRKPAQPETFRQGKSVHSETVLNPGSYLLSLQSQSTPIATWGGDVDQPAAITSGRLMVLNWNWQTPMPSKSMGSALAYWEKQIAASQKKAKSEDPLIHSIAPDGRIVARVQLDADRVEEDKVAKKLPSPTPEQLEYAQALAATVPKAMQPVLAPPAGQQQVPGEQYGDTNPQELYEFEEFKAEMPETAQTSPRMQSQSSVAEFYNDKMREYSELEQAVNHLAGLLQPDSPRYEFVKQSLSQALQLKSQFETAWFQHRYQQALVTFEKSKDLLTTVLFNHIPRSTVEARAIWLDRGSIVQSGGPEGLRKIIRRIANAGFNIIYFETVNAGFPIYPSKLVEQNPQIKDWDPLSVAVDEAHRQNVELHAWVWTFAVGNARHNRILGLPASYPGPILSLPEMADEVLRGHNGERQPPGQPEFWLSPSSQKTRGFLTDLFSEIVRNYPVDGLQLDYIRYPFQKPATIMGYEAASLDRFYRETGLDVAEPNEFTMKAWTAWKAFQVTLFVKELSATLLAINPELKLSAAVFPLPRHSRMVMIQQDWETWVRNGWIHTLNPMAYSRSARSLQRLVSYIHDNSEDKVLVYPGLSLIRLNALELLDTLEISRQTGVMGTTLFAYSQLDPDKQQFLQIGPYQQKDILPPHRDPMRAAKDTLAETRSLVEGIMRFQAEQPAAVAGSAVDDLTQIQATLRSLSENLDKLQGQVTGSFDRDFYFRQARDDAKLLAIQAENWANRAHDPLEAFQARQVGQLAWHTARLVNYAVFRLDNPTGKQVPAAAAAN